MRHRVPSRYNWTLLIILRIPLPFFLTMQKEILGFSQMFLTIYKLQGFTFQKTPTFDHYGRCGVSIGIWGCLALGTTGYESTGVISQKNRVFNHVTENAKSRARRQRIRAPVNFFWGPPSRTNRLKILTVNQKD